MSRVTYFILRAHKGTVLATINAGKTREGFGKNAGKWTGRIEISKEEIPGNMSGYIRTCFRPRRENLWALGSQQLGALFLRPQYPTAGFMTHVTLCLRNLGKEMVWMNWEGKNRQKLLTVGKLSIQSDLPTAGFSSKRKPSGTSALSALRGPLFPIGDIPPGLTCSGVGS